MVLPECRPLWTGVERADSLVFNPHKWMGVGFDFSAYYARDPEHLIRVMSTNPTYLRTAEDGAVTNYRDWQIPLGRRFRALKLWFYLLDVGVDGLQARLRRDLANAQWLKDQVDAAPDWERLAPVPLQTVCVRHVPQALAGDEPALTAHNLAIARTHQRQRRRLPHPQRPQRPPDAPPQHRRRNHRAPACRGALASAAGRERPSLSGAGAFRARGNGQLYLGSPDRAGGVRDSDRCFEPGEALLGCSGERALELPLGVALPTGLRPEIVFRRRRWLRWLRDLVLPPPLFDLHENPEIRPILLPTRCLFHLDEVGNRNDGDDRRSDRDELGVPKELFEVDRRLDEEIDRGERALRLIDEKTRIPFSSTHSGAGRHPRSRAHRRAQRAETQTEKRRDRPPRRLGSEIDDQIEVDGQASMSVQDDGQPADDDIASPCSLSRARIGS